MSDSSASNNRYWEQYLVRYMVPTIITSCCLAFLFYNNKLTYFGLSWTSSSKVVVCNPNFKYEVLDLNDIKATLWIVFFLVSFAIQYILTAISMIIHIFRFLTPVKWCDCIYKYYIKKYETDDLELLNNAIDNFLKSASHLREHGAAFLNSFWAILFTCFYWLCPKTTMAFLIILCLIGGLAGMYVGIILEKQFIDADKTF